MRGEYLFVVRVDPVARQLAIEVLSEIMSFAAFDVSLSLLFLDRGAYLLSPEIDAEIAGMMAALPLYGVTELYVEKESLEALALTPFTLADRVISLPRAEICQWMLQYQGVLGA
ncbi:MAG TPA: hypothetical protein DCY52_08405 [Methylococcaceae bacterium]|nr:hypothetical protein [Methylococcaceae bacterium]